MSKFKTWLTQRNKLSVLIVGVVIVMLFVCVFLIIKNQANSNKGPIIVFNEDIYVEYGSELSQDEIIELAISPSSKYDEITKIPPLDTTTVTVKNKNDATRVDARKAVVWAKKGEQTKSFSFEYHVLDTREPIISGPETHSLFLGEFFNVASLYKAVDSVDGELPVVVRGDYDVNVPGTYEIAISATDKNGLFKVYPVVLSVRNSDGSLPDDTTVSNISPSPDENITTSVEDQNALRERIVLNDPIIIPAEGPLGIGRIIDLDASDLDGETISIAYKTRNDRVTLFMPYEMDLSQFLYPTAEDCNREGLKVNEEFDRQGGHGGISCAPLSNGYYGLTVISGSGARYAYLDSPVTDTIIINVSGKKVQYEITYYRRLIGNRHELLEFQSR